MHISREEMEDVLYLLFLKYHFSEEKAIQLAHVYTESTLSGVHSHGINRVPLFIEYVEKGVIQTDAEAEKISEFGSIERWDGKLGPGIINAMKCTDRAIELSRRHGVGMVALRNTNHWMRGGTYGWQAAKAGCIAIMFTNTLPNMPPWGGAKNRIGNNPFVVAIPRKGGHVVLDMALSQFSFGKMDTYRLNKEQLPYAGGWNDANQLSSNPEEILSSGRALPIGYWKGSALSMVLDMLVTLLSAGESTYKIGLKSTETEISQLFLCIDPTKFHDRDIQEKLLNEIIDYTHDVESIHPDEKVYYPGERLLLTQERNLLEGMIVDNRVWQQVMDLM